MTIETLATRNGYKGALRAVRFRLGVMCLLIIREDDNG
jgi:hypothetical protein